MSNRDRMRISRAVACPKFVRTKSYRKKERSSGLPASLADETCTADRETTAVTLYASCDCQKLKMLTTKAAQLIQMVHRCGRSATFSKTAVASYDIGFLGNVNDRSHWSSRDRSLPIPSSLPSFQQS